MGHCTFRHGDPTRGESSSRAPAGAAGITPTSVARSTIVRRRETCEAAEETVP
jgi:hypothetical protein